jgi:hypothetical protein
VLVVMVTVVASVVSAIARIPPFVVTSVAAVVETVLVGAVVFNGVLAVVEGHIVGSISSQVSSQTQKIVSSCRRCCLWPP